MMSLTLLFLCGLVATPGEWLLENSRDVRVGDPNSLRVARDGSFLMANGPMLWHWDAEGRFLRKIDGPSLGTKGFKLIIAFHYDSRRQIYWIVDNETQKSQFYDRNLRFLGTGKEEQPHSNGGMVIRQLLPVSYRLFALDIAGIDEWQSEVSKVLRPVSFHLEENGVTIRKLGGPFAPISVSQREFGFNFKLHWMVQDGFSFDFYVVDQLAREMRLYSGRLDENRQLTMANADQRLPLYMPKAVPLPPAQDREKYQGPELGRWLQSFSRIQGLYPLKRGMIVGYSLPDESNFHGKLVLQPLTMDGHPQGASRTEEGFLMGTAKDGVYLLDKQNPDQGGQLRVRRLEF